MSNTEKGKRNPRSNNPVFAGSDSYAGNANLASVREPKAGFFTRVRYFMRTVWMFTWRFMVLGAIASSGFFFKNSGDSLIHFIFDPTRSLWAWGGFGAVVGALFFVVTRRATRSFPFLLLTAGVPLTHKWDDDPYLVKKHDDDILEKTINSGASRNSSRRSSTVNDQHSSTSTVEPINRASRMGKDTPYVPRELDKVPVPVLPNMFGTPGSGLDEARGIMGNKAVNAGQMGETNFAKALSITSPMNTIVGSEIGKTGSILSQVRSFWSVAMPSRDNVLVPDSRNTDIDCIITVGRDIHLIDLKFYQSGDVTFTTFPDSTIAAVDNETGQIVGSKKKMSKNMSMAKDRFVNAYGNKYNVHAYVVIVPTNSGEGAIANGAVYPGGVPVVNMSSMVWKLSQAVKKNGAVQGAPSQVERNLTKLLK